MKKQILVLAFTLLTLAAGFARADDITSILFGNSSNSNSSNNSGDRNWLLGEPDPEIKIEHYYDKNNHYRGYSIDDGLGIKHYYNQNNQYEGYSIEPIDK